MGAWALILLGAFVSFVLCETGMRQIRRLLPLATVAAVALPALVPLVEQAGLARTLEGKGPFTLFAPTDAAFAKAPKATLAALKHDRTKLRAVLLYHVLRGKVTAAEVVGPTP